jgi:hypothetical protein
MLSLDKVVAGAKVRGLAGAVPVEVVRTEWIGSDALTRRRGLHAQKRDGRAVHQAALRSSTQKDSLPRTARRCRRSSSLSLSGNPSIQDQL